MNNEQIIIKLITKHDNGCESEIILSKAQSLEEADEKCSEYMRWLWDCPFEDFKWDSRIEARTIPAELGQKSELVLEKHWEKK